MEYKEKRVVYLLGAGFSQAITNNRAPSTEDLGRQLGEVFDAEDRKKYNFSEDDIELFMTKVDLELESEEDNSKLRNCRKNAERKILEISAISKLCNITNNKIEITKTANQVTKFIFKKNDTILTLNYDCYLENVLLNMSKWSPEGGYGDALGFDPNPDHNENKKLLNIEIFKLHGSINFILVSPLDVGGFNPKKIFVKYLINNELFPGSAIESSWEGTEKLGYIVLPSYLKQFEYKSMLMLWMKAALRLREANKLVIIGTSLRKEDYPLRLLISFFNKEAKIIIIDEKAEDIKKKMCDSIPIKPGNIDSLNMKIEDIGDEIEYKIYDA